jgi:hypothetical protein
VPTTGIRAEDKLIGLLTVYDDCSWAGQLSVKVSPERTVDGGVEMLATRARDGQKLAIEHTLIEPFVGEKTDFLSHYQELARQLKADESLQVPGFSIAVEAPVNVLPYGQTGKESSTTYVYGSGSRACRLLRRRRCASVHVLIIQMVS